MDSQIFKSEVRKYLFWATLAIGILSSSYAVSHRFLHDRMKFNCHEIGCMAGEPDEVTQTCRCGEVNILELPCEGKVECRSADENCTGGRYCKTYLPDCLKGGDCKNIYQEDPPSLEKEDTN